MQIMDQDVLDKAHELGQAIVNSPSYQRMKLAQDEVEGNELCQLLIAEYVQQQELVEQLMEQDNDGSPEDLRRAVADLKRAEETLDEDAHMQELMITRKAFQQLVRQMNGILQSVITGGEPPECGEGCGGGCPGCAGGSMLQ